MTDLIDWLQAHETIWATLGILSVLTFVISLLVLPVIIVLLPTDYFVRPEKLPRKVGPLRLTLRLLKNLLGLFIFIAGVLMLFLPGQGILGMLVGCSLVDFPGKRKVQLALLKSKRVRRSVDWVRRKANREPLDLPARDGR